MKNSNTKKYETKKSNKMNKSEKPAMYVYGEKSDKAKKAKDAKAALENAVKKMNRGKEETHWGPAALKKIFAEVNAEIYRARSLHPSCSLAAIMEEAGEVARALQDEDLGAIRRECVQLACTALRVALEGDPTMDPYRATKGLDATVRDPRPTCWVEVCAITYEDGEAVVCLQEEAVTFGVYVRHRRPRDEPELAVWLVDIEDEKSAHECAMNLANLMGGEYVNRVIRRKGKK